MKILFVCTGQHLSQSARRSDRAKDRDRARPHDVEAIERRHERARRRSGERRRAARRHGAEHGSRATHRAQTLSRELVREADLILAMGPHHLERIEALGGAGRAYLLSDYASHGASSRADQRSDRRRARRLSRDRRRARGRDSPSPRPHHGGAGHGRGVMRRPRSGWCCSGIPWATRCRRASRTPRWQRAGIPVALRSARRRAGDDSSRDVRSTSRRDAVGATSPCRTRSACTPRATCVTPLARARRRGEHVVDGRRRRACTATTPTSAGSRRRWRRSSASRDSARSDGRRASARAARRPPFSPPSSRGRDVGRARLQPHAGARASAVRAIWRHRATSR